VRLLFLSATPAGARPCAGERPRMTAASASNHGKNPQNPRNKTANCEKPHIDGRFCALICPLPGFGRRCRKWRTPMLQEQASANGEVAVQPERKEAFIRLALILPCSILLERGAARKAVSHQHGEGGVPITGEVRAARPGLAFFLSPATSARCTRRKSRLVSLCERKSRYGVDWQGVAQAR